jgi:hypothetical protein
MNDEPKEITDKEKIKYLEERVGRLENGLKKIINPHSNFGYHYIHLTTLEELKKLLEEVEV